MKRILCLLGVLGIVSSPVMAKGIAGVTTFPYKEYTQEVQLNKIATDTTKNDIVTIEKK